MDKNQECKCERCNTCNGRAVNDRGLEDAYQIASSRTGHSVESLKGKYGGLPERMQRRRLHQFLNWWEKELKRNPSKSINDEADNGLYSLGL